MPEITHKTSLAHSGLIRMTTGPLRWYIHPASQSLTRLFENTTLDSLLKTPPFCPVKQNPLRSVYRFSHQDSQYYLKCYHAPGLIEKIKRTLRPCPAQKEFTLLQRLACLRIPAPQPIAWACAPHQSDHPAILITASLGQNTSLEQILWHPNNAQLTTSLQAAADLIAHMHHHHIEHHDLHYGNILLCHTPNTDHACITDLQNVTIRKPRLQLPPGPDQRWRKKNLASLMTGIYLTASHEQILLFIRHYLQAADPHHTYTEPQVEAYWNQLKPIVLTQLDRLYRKRDRRCLRNSRYAAKIQLPAYGAARVFLQTKRPLKEHPSTSHTFTPQQWAHTLAHPEQLLQNADILKPGGRNTVAARTLTIGNKTIHVVIKHSRLRKGLYGLIDKITPSRAIRQWLKAHQLISRRLPTAFPLAALEKRKNHLLCESIFICEHITPAANLRQHLLDTENPPSPSLKKQETKKLAQLLAKLQNEGFKHRDCKAANILIHHSGQPLFVDLDGIHLRILHRYNATAWINDRVITPLLNRFPSLKIFAFLHRRHQPLTRLAASLYALPGASPRDFLRTFNLYLRQFPSLTLTRRQKKILRDKLSRTIRRRALRGPYMLPFIPFKNILIIKPSSLGDVVRTLPVLYQLRQRYPAAQITWLIQPPFAPLLKSIPELDHILLFDRRQYGKILYRPDLAWNFFRFIRSLHQKHFDLVLDLQGLFRSGFLARCAAAPVRLGPAAAREAAHVFYTHHVPAADDDEHAVHGYLRFGAFLKLPQTTRTDFALSDQTRNQAADILAAHSINIDQTYITFLPGGTKPQKQWPPESFAAIADKIHNQYHLPILILGAGQAEQTIAQQIIQKTKAKPVNLIDKTSLDQLAAVIAASSLTIGNDSGPLHIAAAMNTPLIGLYGPTNPAVVGPYAHPDSVIQPPDQNARPKNQRYSKLPQHQIKNITIDQVWTSTQTKLKRYNESP